MLNWVKNTVGVTEPVYGPTAIQSVAEQAKTTPYSELKREDLAWACMDSTNVESKSFYMHSDEGHVGLLQVIYSNVLGVRTTAQFSTKIMYPTPGQPHLWSTDNVSHFSFSADKQNFKADGCSMELSEDGTSYMIKSNVNKNSVVDMKFTRLTPGFVAGENGTSYFGTDPMKPWGRMLHAFWPRCKVEGTIITKQGPVNFNGGGALSHALQGMKPHFAASKWNFCDFQSPSYSAILMDFVTPPSYGHTTVATGVIATDAGILIGGASPQVKAQHTQVRGDPDNDWPEPGAVLFSWEGQTKDGKSVKAELSGTLPARIDRVDVMGELPKFVKQIVAGASGTKPYIYQYTPKMTIKVTTDGEEKMEEGNLFMEATFIS